MPRVAFAARVLLVDDEAVIARSVARMLASEGYEVVVASGGREAIAQVESLPFDVIVSDIHMPDIDGLSLLRAIRSRDLDVPVVFLTGNPALDSAVKAIEYGAFRYLLKPVARDNLIDVVARAVRWRRLALVRREAARELQGKPIGDRAGLEARFGAALENLWIATQPIVSWSARSIYAYEVLVRTDEPTLASPVDLIDAAERLDRTVELGRMIRARAAELLRATSEPLRLFVNLHPADLADPELLSDDGVLSPFASRVALEVTERASLDGVSGLGGRVSRLRQIGYRIALDDLGAGYAGLTSFAHLEPDVVKVDMALVRGIDGSALKQKLLRSMAALCGDLRIELIAEGVETGAERDCASALGGDLFQGYLFARPDRGLPEPHY
jgi:EAL domain-containing protein (putative c-di-GMP-specific phosphodiesterase class I)